MEAFASGSRPRISLSAGSIRSRAEWRRGQPCRSSVRRAAGAVPTERLVERARIIKDDVEISTLREAGRRLGEIARHADRFVAQGRTERAVAAEIEAAMRVAGFSRPAFETIVASGPNSVLPHARPTERQICMGDPTVLDFGGVYDGYCVDLRVRSAWAPSRPAKAVFGGQRGPARAIESVGPIAVRNTTPREVGPRPYGLGDAFGHGTGHGLGLEVHEEPRIARASPRLQDAVVEPGMVFTIEPGAYVAGVGGVRIEDDVLVTEHGCEVLTR